MMLCLPVMGRETMLQQADTTITKTQKLGEVTIKSRRAGTRKLGGAINGVKIHIATPPLAPSKSNF